MTLVILLLAMLSLGISGTTTLSGAGPVLRPNDFVMIAGDSITEQRIYSVFMEDYLLMCEPSQGVRTMQFGWGGEVSWGFLARGANFCLQFKPSVVTTSFGMNDRLELSPGQDKLAHYRESMAALIRKFTEAGARVVVGSPGCVDLTIDRRLMAGDAVIYNGLLAQERDVARGLAEKAGVGFADVFQPMYDVMLKAKAKHGKEYHVAGQDGVHPAANGHLIMAYAFLKALGCNGDIGTITLDLSAQRATATDGHSVKSFQNNVATIQSSRYPFCFLDDPEKPGQLSNPNNPRGILDFFPFNEDLNRFKLIVTGATSDRLRVTWGEASKEFAAADLAEGINLAAEFLDNPFVEPFKRVHEAARAQQDFEMALRQLMVVASTTLPDDAELLAHVVAATSKKQQALSAAAVSEVAPVTHTIKVELVQ